MNPWVALQPTCPHGIRVHMDVGSAAHCRACEDAGKKPEMSMALMEKLALRIRPTAWERILGDSDS